MGGGIVLDGRRDHPADRGRRSRRSRPPAPTRARPVDAVGERAHRVPVPRQPFSTRTASATSGPGHRAVARGRRSRSTATRSWPPDRWADAQPQARGARRLSRGSAGGPGGGRAGREPRRSGRPGAARDPGLLDHLALGVAAADAPHRASRAASAVGAGRGAASTQQRSARARGATTSRWVAWSWARPRRPARRGPGRRRGRAGQRRRACRGTAWRAAPGVAIDRGGHLLQPRDGVGAGGQRPAPQQRAGVDQRPAARGVLGPQLGVVARGGRRRGRRSTARAGRRARRSG